MKEFLKNILNREFMREPLIPLYFSFLWGGIHLFQALEGKFDDTSNLSVFGLIFPFFFFSLWGIIIYINNGENKKKPNK